MLPTTPLWLALPFSPHIYRRRLRIEKANSLLASPVPRKLHAVAEACDFANRDRTRLVFERFAGMSPTQYCRKYARDRGPD